MLSNPSFVVIVLIFVTLSGVIIADIIFDKPLTSNLPSEFIGVAASAGVTVFIVERAVRAAERRRIKPLGQSFRSTAENNAEVALMHITSSLGIQVEGPVDARFQALEELIQQYKGEYLTDRLTWFRCQALVRDLDQSVNPIVVAANRSSPFLATRVDLLKTLAEVEINFVGYCRRVSEQQAPPFNLIPEDTKVAIVDYNLKKLANALLRLRDQLRREQP